MLPILCTLLTRHVEVKKIKILCVSIFSDDHDDETMDGARCRNTVCVGVSGDAVRRLPPQT